MRIACASAPERLTWLPRCESGIAPFALPCRASASSAGPAGNDRPRATPTRSTNWPACKSADMAISRVLSPCPTNTASVVPPERCSATNSASPHPLSTRAARICPCWWLVSTSGTPCAAAMARAAHSPALKTGMYEPSASRGRVLTQTPSTHPGECANSASSNSGRRSTC